MPLPAAPAPKPAPAPAAGPPSAAAMAAAPVSATKKTSFLNALKPKPLEESKPTNCALVIGNRGCKTIAAVAVDTPGGKSANGRVDVIATKGLPRPPGSRCVVVTFDSQSGQSLLNHYGTMLGEGAVQIVSMMDPVIDDEGRLVYPGWDGANADSGPIVAAAFKEVLLSFREAQDVGLLVIDKYDTFISNVAKFVAYAKAKVPLDGKLEMNQWTTRSNLLLDIDFLVRTAPMRGGWVIATGSRDLKDGDEKLAFVDGGKGVKKQVVPANWQEKVHSEWPNILQVYKLSLPRGGYAWEAEVEEGRHPIFPLGARVDITGSHIGKFQEADALKFPAPEDAIAKIVAPPVKR